MIRRLSVLMVAAAVMSGPVAASDLTVPSGHVLSLQDVMIDEDMARFRFVLPQVGAGVEFADLVDDIQYLCESIAVPALAEANQTPSQLVVSVAAAPVVFGEATDVTQFFQPFRIDGTACHWEEF